MKLRSFFQFMFFGLIALILVSVVAAFAAGMVIEPSTVDRDSMSVSPNDLKPTYCSGMNLNQIVEGSGTFNGTANSDLILGSTGDDTIDGGDGDDCILGGDGNDVCTGGAGNDIFVSCETVTDP